MKKLFIYVLLSVPIIGFGQTKISDMPAATTPTGTELVPIVQGGYNKKATIDQINSGYIKTANFYTIGDGRWLKLPALPGIGQDGQSLRWNNGTGLWEYFTASAGNLTGAITSSGLATSLGSFTSNALGTAISDPVRTVTGTDAIVQADNGRTIYFNSATPFNFTIDALTINTFTMFRNIGTATVSFVDGSGVTSTGATALLADEVGGIEYIASTTPIISVAGGGGSSLTLVDGNGTTVNGTGDGVDLGGTTTSNYNVTGIYDQQFERSQPFVVSGPGWNAIDLTRYKLQSGGFKLDASLSNDGGVFGTRTAKFELVNDLNVSSSSAYYQWLMNSVDPVIGYTSLFQLDPYYFRIKGGTAAYSFLDFDFANSIFRFKRESDDNGFYFNSSGVWFGGSSFANAKFGYDATGSVINLGSDATGDTYYRNSSGYFTRLAAGTNGHVLTLASGIPSWAAPSGGGLTVGTSTITSGTNTKVLYNNSGVLGEYTVSGTGNVALTTSPVFTTPNIGTATGTASGNYSLASGGTATGTNTFAMGTNPFILTSGVTTGTGATAGIQNVFNSLTTGNGLDISSSSVSSGAIVKITGTGTAAASSTQKGLWVDVSGANSTSTQTTYGGYFSNTKTGTSATNVGLYSTASGGTTNLALSLLGGMKVQTGATGGDVDFLASGGSNWMRFDNTQIIRFQLGVSSNNRITPQTGGLEFMSPGGATVGYKYNFLSQAALTGTSGTNVLFALGENASGTRIGSTLSSGTTTNKMLLITGAWNFTGSYSGILQSIDIDPTLTSETGLTYIALRSTAASGKLLWGGTTVTSGSVLADFQSTTLGIMMPRVTNIASVSTPVAGMIAYDAATDKFNFRQGSGWSLLGLTQALPGTQTGTAITSDANVTSTQSISAFSSTVTSAGVSTQVIYDPSVLSNNSTAEIEITVTGIKTDGTSSFSVSVKGLFRKDNSGTVTMDVAGTQDLKELTASTVVSLVPLVNSGYPSATLTMGASSGTYAIKGITKAIITKL